MRHSDIFDVSEGKPPPRNPVRVTVSHSGAGRGASAASSSPVPPTTWVSAGGGASTLPPRGGSTSTRVRASACSGAVAVRKPATEFPDRRVDVGQHLVEVFFVLAGMLNSKRRVDTQDRLHNVGLTSVLSSLIDNFDWGFEPVGPLPRIHGPTCACHANSAQQIQLLRLLHAYVDRDTDAAVDRWVTRRRVISSSEESAILHLDTLVPATLDSAQSVDRVVMKFVQSRTSTGVAPAHSGVMARLVHLLMTSTFTSPYRFWLSSCIETFLRGSPVGARRWVANSGLIVYLVSCIVNAVRKLDLQSAASAALPSLPGASPVGTGGSSRAGAGAGATAGAGAGAGAGASGGDSAGEGEGEDGSESETSRYSIQTAFDLLGELCKFNVEAILMLDHLPFFPAGVNTPHPGAISDILRALCGRLVDSNVFLRSLLLSFDLHGTPNTPVGIALAGTQLYRFLSENRVAIVYLLLRSVPLEAVNQENICALNTAIMVCMLAKRRNALPALMESLLEYARNPSLRVEMPTVPTPACDTLPAVPDDTVLENFANLLRLWGRYYSVRGRDQRGLVTSSGFAFGDWKATVRQMLSCLERSA